MSLPSSPTAPGEPVEEAAEAGSHFPILWLAGGAVFLLLAMLAGYFFWRRSSRLIVPEIERPIIAGAHDQPASAPSDARIDIGVDVIGLSRSFMMMTLNCQISIANRSGRAVRDISISADISSAHRSLPVEQQLALAGTALPPRTTIERIGPHQSRGERLSLQIPVAEINGFRQGEAALCVPLLRLRIESPSIAPQTRTYAIGLDAGGLAARLQPIPLHVPPGSYDHVRARSLD